MDAIGVVGEPDHPVFSRVAERLAARGFEVEFFSPTEPFDRTALGALDALVNTTIRRSAFDALRYADGRGVETWNGFVPTTALSARLVALHALERVGCPVPDVWLTEPAEETVERRRYRWDGPVRDERATFYQERIRTTPVDFRYYAVDDGVETHVHAMRLTSKLGTDDLATQEADVDVELATRVRELLDRFGARALAVTFVPGRDDVYAVDVDVAPTFTGAGLERRVADSWASLATIGA